MKIRHDFVTNSSSSSFIIAVKNWNEIQDLEKQSDTLRSIVRGFEKAFRIYPTFKRKKEITEHYKSYYGDIEKLPEDMKKLYETALEKFDQGYVFFDCSVEYGAEEIIQSFEDKENIFIVGHGD